MRANSRETDLDGQAAGAGRAAGQISASEADWGREVCRGIWDPGLRLLRSIRDYQKWQARHTLLGRIMSKWCVLRHRYWSTASGADIPLDTIIGGGLKIPHPSGIVVHPGSRIGPNCLIFQQVTLGTSGPGRGVPTLGGHVDIGAGAKVLGAVRVGDHAKIGANAVVLSDVPAGATAVGVPARILPADSPRDGGTSETVRPGGDNA